MKTLREAVDRIEEGLLAALLAFMTLLTFVQVVLREFNVSMIWSLEATTYSFGALVLFGMSYCVRTRAHISVDLLLRRLPKQLQRPTHLVAVAACVLYAIMMLYGSVTFVERLHALGNMARDVPAPKWLLTITMPIGFALLAFRFLQVGWRLLRSSGDGVGQLSEQPSHGREN
ncbi:MAG: TRAP transporter small permease [Gammaproteobacteria bacterium]|nr:TRAP transporter small permease [Gammaproteobacteria bacterium]MDH5311351.1 TRAP transporter small permease [Gammaproteobacteria bacterium]